MKSQERTKVVAELGKRYDSIWKGGQITRKELNTLSIALLKLKFSNVMDFNIGNLTMHQLSALTLYLNFNFPVIKNHARKPKIRTK